MIGRDGEVGCWAERTAFARRPATASDGVFRVQHVQDAVALAMSPRVGCALLRTGRTRCWSGREWQSSCLGSTGCARSRSMSTSRAAVTPEAKSVVRRSTAPSRSPRPSRTRHAQSCAPRHCASPRTPWSPPSWSRERGIIRVRSKPRGRSPAGRSAHPARARVGLKSPSEACARRVVHGSERKDGMRPGARDDAEAIPGSALLVLGGAGARARRARGVRDVAVRRRAAELRCPVGLEAWSAGPTAIRARRSCPGC